MFVDGFLQGLNLPPAELLALRSALMEYADEARAAKPEAEVPAASFGGSDLGANVGYHAGLADQALKEALINVVQGLRSHSKGMGEFVADFGQTDEVVHANLTHLHKGLERIDAPVQAPPPGSPLPQPPASDGGGA